MNKFFFIVLFYVIAHFCFSQKQTNPSTKYIEFRENGKDGLCDLKGKTIVAPDNDEIKDHCDKFYLGNKAGKGFLRTIKGKTIFQFPSEITESTLLPAGSLVITDSASVYLFDASLQLMKTIPYTMEPPEIRSFENIFVLYSEEKKDSIVYFPASVYDTKNCKLKGTYLCKSDNDFNTDRLSASPRYLYFEVEGLNASNPLLEKKSLLDSLGNLILEWETDKRERRTDWFERKDDKLFEIDWDKKMDELIRNYYSKRKIKEELKNISCLQSLTINDSLALYKIKTFNGDVIKSFPPGTEVERKLFERSDEVSRFIYTVYNSASDNTLELYMNTEFEIIGDSSLATFESKDENFSHMEQPDDARMVFFIKNKQVHLFSLITKKDIMVFTPDENSLYNSKGMLPLSEPMEEETMAYKEENSFGLLNYKTGKKTELFNYKLPAGMRYDYIRFGFSNTENLLDVKVELESLDTINGKGVDSSLTFLKKNNGAFFPVNGKYIDRLNPLKTYDTLSPESAYFSLPFYNVTSEARNDSINIMDGDGKFILRENKKQLYWVGKKFLGLSDGKTSKIYDTNLKELKRDIPDQVCASINESLKDLICYDNARNYFLYNNGKRKKLFSENELMGWPATFVNHPDSENYRENCKIVHAEKYGNKLLLFQNVTAESMYKLALYDMEKEKLYICPSQYYYDFLSQNEIPALKQFEKRFLLLKKNFDSAACFSNVFSPKFVLDTLEYAAGEFYDDDGEQIGLLEEQYRDFHLFYSKKSSNRYYFGTMDSIYYTFSGSVVATEWDCGIKYFGNSESDFFLIDPVTRKLSADKYLTLRVDDEMGCGNNNFVAANKRTGLRELYLITPKGNQKIFEGNFSSYQGVETYNTTGWRKQYCVFYDNNYQIVFITDGKFKLIYDTAQFVIAPGSDPFMLWEGGTNILILKARGKEEFFLYNAVTEKMQKIQSSSVSVEGSGIDNFVLLIDHPDQSKSNLKEIVLLPTGETIKDYDMDTYGEWFVFNKKLYYKIYNEDGERVTEHIFNARKEKIR